MNLLDGANILRRRRVSAVSSVAVEAIKIGGIGIIHDIASVIENRKTIKNDKVLKSAFKKIEFSAMTYFSKNRGDSSKILDQEESGVISTIAEVAKDGILDVLKIGGRSLFRVFGQAVRLAIIPVFRIFCAAITTVFRTILMSPYTIAATAVISAALGARKMFLTQRENEVRAPYIPKADEFGSSAPGAPKNESERIVQETILEAAKRNGVSPVLALNVANIESSLNPNASSKTSSAKGLFGIIDKTWVGLGGKPGEERDLYKNADLGTKYLSQNYVSLKSKLGREVSPYEVYASHFFGPRVSALLKVQDALADFPIEEGLKTFASEKTIRNIMSQNPMLRGKTVGEVMSFMRSKVGHFSMASSSEPQQAFAASGSFMIPTSGVFTSPFGFRTFKGPLGLTVTGNHLGIDIANEVGSAIYAADSGVVTTASVASAGYGTRIDINHGNGFLTRYGHSSKLFVKAGDSVKKGQQIAAMGSTGFSSGPHLHFEFHKTTGPVSSSFSPVNPTDYLPGFPKDQNQPVSMRTVSDSFYSQTKQYVKLGEKIVALRER